ncbi:MAG: LptE family protein [Chthoniobacterales bacterium]
MKAFSCALLLAATLCGCAGYHIGEIKPQYLKGVHTIAIPTFKNGTYLPRIEVLVTNTVIKQFQQDGTFRIANEENADAVLHCTIASVGRHPARSVRGNVLATTEFNLALIVSYTLVGRDGKALTGPISVAGTTSFFVGADVTTEEGQALPLAAEDMAVRLVSQLSEGW